MSTKRRKEPKAPATPAPLLLGPVTVRAIELARQATALMHAHDELRRAADAEGVSDSRVEEECGRNLLDASDALWELAVWYARGEADRAEDARAA